MRFLNLDSQCKKIKEQTNAHTYILTRILYKDKHSHIILEIVGVFNFPILIFE